MKKVGRYAVLWLASATAFGGAQAAQPNHPDVHRVFGECIGRILITPTKLDKSMAPVTSSLLEYDCARREFVEIERTVGRVAFTDLTAGPSGGYYYGRALFTDGVLHGELRVIERSGEVRRVFRRKNMDLHDVIYHPDGGLIFMKMEMEATTCIGGVSPLHVALIEEDSLGTVLWSWSSRGHIDSRLNVSTLASVGLPERTWWRDALKRLRHCLTVAAVKLTNVEVPKYIAPIQGTPVLQYTSDDFLHANSLQQLPNGNLLVSARHLDAIFEVDRSTGRVAMAIAGPMSKMNGIRVMGDPLRGFSHQHAATLTGDTLLLFDNGNRLGRHSRAVIYEIDRAKNVAKFIGHFEEPNRRLRPATGSAYFINPAQVIVGWGFVAPQDQGTPQRGVSIFNVQTGAEEFGIDFAPGVHSYRAKWAPSIAPYGPKPTSKQLVQ